MRISKQLPSIKKIPRTLVALIASIAAALFFILPALTQQPVTIKVLIQALEAEQLQPIVEEFEKQNPDINLDIIEAPNETNQVEDLYTSAFLLGESPYDLVYMDIVWVPKFAASGWLMPLSDRVSQEELEQFLNGDVNGGTYEGELYRMPFRSDVGMLYYRTDWLKQAGYKPPETFDDLVQISQDLQSRDTVEWGYLWQGKQYEGLSAMFVEILEGFGGFWVDPDTLKVGLDQPEAIQGAEFLRSLIKKNISPPGITTYAEPATHRLFINGESVFLRNWPYVYGLALDSPIEGEFAIKEMPHSRQGSSGASQGGWGLGISANTKHPEEAWRVVEFLSKAETQKEYSLRTGYLPSRRALYTNPELVAKYPYFPELLKVIENSVLRPPIAQYSQTSDILQRYLSAALTGTMSPEEAMNTAARETRAVLEQSK
ncbi:MAG: ABC transporter substrate-binding protein [Cyanobacteria bacterium QH_2_48_84]|nr:MAG: ABC transporter substrate-binding protein [Cyanobacteria bacterium QH_2_48_84]